MLVLQRVGQLVGERDPDRRGELGAPDRHLLGVGVVERERAGVGQLVGRGFEVDLARHEAEGPQLGDGVAQLGAVLVGQGLVVADGRLAVVGGAEELDVDRMIEVEVTLLLDEVGDRRDAGVPRRGDVRLVADRPGDDPGDQQHQHRRAADQPQLQAVADVVHGAARAAGPRARTEAT